MTNFIETKAAAAAKRNTSKSLVQQLDGVCADRVKWEEGAYRTSTEQLYAILGRCLHIYQQMKDDMKLSTAASGAPKVPPPMGAAEPRQQNGYNIGNLLSSWK